LIDLDVALYWTSLALSAAGVVLFLWLMRERKDDGGRETGNGKRETGRDELAGR
jgi:hypothetical protein